MQLKGPQSILPPGFPANNSSSAIDPIDSINDLFRESAALPGDSLRQVEIQR